MRFDNSCYNRYIVSMASKLQKELKQTKPFTSLKEEVFVAFQLTAERLKLNLIETLKCANLTGPQYNTRLLDRLEARKLISRQRQTKDRRIVLTFITDEGLAVLNELEQPINDCHERQLGHLTKKQLTDLSRLLEIVRNSPD